MMKSPIIDKTVYIADGAKILGDVVIGADSSVWYNAVIRGDISAIKIGSGSNIQDCCVLHTDPAHSLIIGDGVTCGHGAVLHGCLIGSNTVVGMGSVVLSGAVIGEQCIIGGGSVLPGKINVPAQSLVFGNPAKVVRSLTADEITSLTTSKNQYINLAKNALK